MCKKTLFAILFSPLLLSAQTELIQNGNFSIPNGSSGAAWVIDNSQGSGYFNFGTTTANMFNSASGYAYSASNVPGPQTNMYQYLKQDNVIVPINASSATFSFYTSAFVQSPATGNEKLFAYIYDVTLNQITSCTTTITFSSGASPGNANGYSQYSLSLPSTHFGHSLQIGFRAQSGSSPATIRVDDVSLTYIAPSCTPPTTPISFTANPSIITAGQPTTLTINGGSLGSAPYWQIYANNNCTGTPVDFTSGNATTIYPNSTTYYYVNATGCGTSTNCLNAIVTVNASCTVPTVTSPTLNATNAGNSTSCFVAASGSPTSFTFNWQVNTGGGWTSLSNNGNTTWSTGGSTSTLTLSNTSLSMNGYQYRCIVSNGCSPDATSSSTTLNVTSGCTPISNITVSGNQTVTAPAQATFTATASGTSPQYQWQYSTDNGNNYNNLSATSPYLGITTNQLVINPTSQNQTSNYYRCQITNACTNPAQYTQGRLLVVNTGTVTPTVTLTYPNGGETWTKGNSTPQPISAFVSNSMPTNWRYYISYNGGANYTLVKSTPSSNTTYNFSNYIPLQNSTTTKIKVEVDLLGGQTINDVSNNVFSVVTPTNGYNFQIDNNPNAISHLFWPFPSSSWNDDPNHANRDQWIGGYEDGTGGGSGFGEAGHLNSDFYAQDWNQGGVVSSGSNLDCDKPFYSPIEGKVIAFRNSCHFNACHYDSITCNSNGNGVFIQSSIDSNFVFHITHLKDNVALTTIGQLIQVGDLIGYIGTTGASNYSHAHCVLYKNVYQNFTYSGITKPAVRWMKENQSSPFLGTLTYPANTFAANFRFDAVLGSGGSSSTPFLPISITNNSTICKGASITITAPIGTSYQWSTGETSQSISITQAGDYYVEVTQQNGDVYNYYQTVNVIDSTTINIFASESLCPNDTILLSCLNTIGQEFPNDNFNHYLWSNGSQSPYIEVTQSGTYTLTFTDGNNCFTTVKSITVNQAQSPNQPTISNVAGNLASSTINGCTYQWFSNGSFVGDGQYLKADTIGSGYYTVQATNKNGCSSLSNPVYVQTTGMSDLYGENVFIYPNPATNLLNIKLLGNLEKGKYEIQNSLGQSILHGDLNNSSINSVDISKLFSGVYFIQLTNGSTKYNSRFLKE